MLLRFTQVITGGYVNQASGYSAAILGGYSNTASGHYTSVGGGRSNDATGVSTVVGGGARSFAFFQFGPFLVISFSAIAIFLSGQYCTADGHYSSIAAGYGNKAFGYAATVGGGHFNTAGSRGSVAFACLVALQPNNATFPRCLQRWQR